ncbi:MAG: DUF1648 domain-containing protein [Xanthomonadales bacterium]|nr:DUF1648 domain-containing protein [Xanthomonadales bacterium]NIN59016.1 DUF1648 domain-containing protein [Xanthomonadales bacterium]NIN74946.1 DUF1648 domain-containing protein [Xanthomonadales bacterium]NIO13363.1 DUF1648 domain-containing protein [Xanthomonadales bacterium]NIP11409.1 DUF1648 domain-containing protein [Xanthomonadales bacterium]
MRVSRINVFTLALVAVMALVAAAYYQSLPDPVPTHWNAAGEVDGWTAKPLGVWLLPLMAGGLSVLLFVLPAISPRGFRLDLARRAYDIVVFLVVAFLAVVEVLAFRAALGETGELARALPIMIGFLFIGLGNYLGKFPKNFFVGIRTPWTLASDAVWNRTHRLAGWLFMAAGVLIVGNGFLAGPAWVLVIMIMFAALVPAVYSFFCYRRLHGFRDEAP